MNEEKVIKQDPDIIIKSKKIKEVSSPVKKGLKNKVEESARTLKNKGWRISE